MCLCRLQRPSHAFSFHLVSCIEFSGGQKGGDNTPAVAAVEKYSIFSKGNIPLLMFAVQPPSPHDSHYRLNFAPRRCGQRFDSCLSVGRPPNGWLTAVNGFLISLV